MGSWAGPAKSILHAWASNREADCHWDPAPGLPRISKTSHDMNPIASTQLISTCCAVGVEQTASKISQVTRSLL